LCIRDRPWSPWSQRALEVSPPPPTRAKRVRPTWVTAWQGWTKVGTCWKINWTILGGIRVDQASKRTEENDLRRTWNYWNIWTQGIRVSSASHTCPLFCFPRKWWSLTGKQQLTSLFGSLRHASQVPTSGAGANWHIHSPNRTSGVSSCKRNSICVPTGICMFWPESKTNEQHIRQHKTMQ
jgi:hypothetical protein